MLKFLFLLIPSFAFAQFQWFNPQSAVGGKLPIAEKYQRLPQNLKDVVRPPLWNLSLHSSGLYVQFTTNSPVIKIQYKALQEIQMPHMPATGVSGMDLYMRDSLKKWEWVKGIHSFSPYIQSQFYVDNNRSNFNEFLLFLPLYQQIDSFQIGIPDSLKLIFSLPSIEPPIIVYGTSIAQGACASRPGMAWTSILQRKMNSPVINLGFSGNGLLEKEIIELMAGTPAQLYILDCLPNLGPGKGVDSFEIKRRIIQSVQIIKNQHPEASILFTEHAGYSDGWVNAQRQNIFTSLNALLLSTIKSLQDSGVKGIHLLTQQEIGLTADDFVDGTHPNDMGMFKYAEAYYSKIKEIQNAKD